MIECFQCCGDELDIRISQENHRRTALHQRGHTRVMNLTEPEPTHDFYSRGQAKPCFTERSFEEWRSHNKKQLLYTPIKRSHVQSEDKGARPPAGLSRVDVLTSNFTLGSSNEKKYASS